MKLRNSIGYSSASISAAVLIGACTALTSCGPRGEGGAENAPDTAVAAVSDSGAAHGAHGHDAPALSTKLEFTAAGGAIASGRPQEWTLRIVDAASGAPVQKFDIEHEKLLHLIVASKDLSWFNHIHPDYKGNGEFSVMTMLPRPGTYRLYADFVAADRGKQVIQHEITTEGAGPASAAALRPDSIGKGGWAVTTVIGKTEGKPDQTGGDSYQVAFMPMNLTPGEDGMLHFQVRDANGTPVADLEPYLGAMGHAVVISADGTEYLHSHPMEAGAMDHDGGHDAHGTTGEAGHSHAAVPAKGGADVMFHTNIPRPGLYKVWGQFQHRGKIITAPFVVSVPG